MTIPILFDDMPAATKTIVNVASVPQRSPFRYPGGKTWLVPRIRQWFASMPSRPAKMIEPFAGGGIVSLTVAWECLAQEVVMVERDEQVAAVWKTIFGTDAQWLADRIVGFDLTPETAKAVIDNPSTDTKDVAFRTILRNRIVHGGILAPGVGILKHGENGKGILSRWYPETLRRRIMDLTTIRERVRFVEGDGMEEMRRYASDPSAVFFIDPPYTAAGKGKRAGTRLYTYNDLDHEELFRLAEASAGDFLMTYDNAESVRELAAEHGFDVEAIAMKNTHHAEMTELLIGRNLDWAR